MRTKVLQDIIDTYKSRLDSAIDTDNLTTVLEEIVRDWDNNVRLDWSVDR